MNCIDPRPFLRLSLFRLRKQKQILKLKKVFGKATQEEIDKVEKEILEIKEFIKKMGDGSIMF